VGTVNVDSRAPACLTFIWRCARRGPLPQNGRRPRSGRVSDRETDPEILPGDHIPNTSYLILECGPIVLTGPGPHWHQQGRRGCRQGGPRGRSLHHQGRPSVPAVLDMLRSPTLRCPLRATGSQAPYFLIKIKSEFVIS
jgi:hypothetical protein